MYKTTSKLSILIITFTLNSCGKLRDFHKDHGDSKRTLIPAFPKLIGLPGPSLDITSENKELKFPGLLGSYNPSIVSISDDSYLVSIRVSGHGHSKHWQEHVILCETDKDFNPIADYSLLNSSYKGAHGCPEDARLFSFRGEPWVIFNNDLSTFRNGSRQMYLSRLTRDHITGQFNTEKVFPIFIDEDRTEKNWSPMEIDGELYMVCNILPYHILKVDLESGYCSDAQSAEESFQWAFGHPRGGTPFIEIDGQLLTVFHSSKWYRYLDGLERPIYVMGAYLCEKHGDRKITAYTTIPISAPCFYDEDNPLKIIFPSGIEKDGDDLVILSGKNDSAILASRIPIQTLLDSMKKVQ